MHYFEHTGPASEAPLTVSAASRATGFSRFWLNAVKHSKHSPFIGRYVTLRALWLWLGGAGAEFRARHYYDRKRIRAEATRRKAAWRAAQATLEAVEAKGTVEAK